MNRVARIAPIVLLAWLGAACKSHPDATQVMAVVDADPGVRDRAMSLELTVRSLPDALEVYNKVLLASLDELVLPYTLALVPKDGDDSRSYEVLVVARDSDGKTVAMTRAQSRYLAHRKLLLALWLRDDCLSVECGDALTCLHGQCSAANTDPAQLPPFSGDQPPAASISRPDAGSMSVDQGGSGGDTGDPCPNGQCQCVEGTSRFCDGTDQGECDRGSQKCIGQRWQPCQGHRSSSPEVCNGLDDDCNGNIDDGATCNPADLLHSSSAVCVKTVDTAGRHYGVCVATGCESSFWADCDNKPENGCEQSLTSLASCVSCGTPCKIENALASCDSGACRVTECELDWADCDGDGTSCETHTSTPTDCGGCGMPCAIDHAISQCSGTPGHRSCELYQCDAGFADCDGNLATGCESDLANDVHNCGACDNDCAAMANIDSGTCGAGVCNLVCKTNFVDCDGDPNNGCEQDLRVGPCLQCLQHTSNVDASSFSYTTAPPVDFSCGGTQTFNSTTRTWSGCCNACPEVSVAVNQADSSAAPIVVLRMTSLTVGAGTTVQLIGQSPVMFAVQGDATIAGTIDASALADTPGAGGSSTASNNNHCGGATGQGGVSQSSGTASSGGGGGGYGTLGGLGGGASAVARSGGSLLGDSDLSPLYAGCAGGLGHASPACVQLAGAGGGAFQLAVAGTLTVTGLLSANGGAAPAVPALCQAVASSRTAGSGGGSGGAILLEAAAFQIDSLSQRTDVSGGLGASGSATDPTPLTTTKGAGGLGSTNAGSLGRPGTYVAPAGGGGGGGYGRVSMRSCLP